jgi:hypothetical protein
MAQPQNPGLVDWLREKLEQLVNGGGGNDDPPDNPSPPTPTPSDDNGGYLIPLDGLKAVKIIQPRMIMPHTIPSDEDNWSFDPLDVNGQLQRIRVFNDDEANAMELQAAALKYDVQHTKRALSALTEAAQHSSEILGANLEARLEVAKTNVGNAQMIARTVSGLAKETPKLAKAQAEVAMALKAAGHTQLKEGVSIMGSLKALEGRR